MVATVALPSRNCPREGMFFLPFSQRIVPSTPWLLPKPFLSTTSRWSRRARFYLVHCWFYPPYHNIHNTVLYRHPYKGCLTSPDVFLFKGSFCQFWPAQGCPCLMTRSWNSWFQVYLTSTSRTQQGPLPWKSGYPQSLPGRTEMDSDSKPPDLRVPNLEIIPPSRRKKPTSWNEKVIWLVDVGGLEHFFYFPIWE